MKRFHSVHGSFYSKILITIISVSILPTLIVSLILFAVAKQNINTEVNKSNMDLINQTKIHVDSMLTSIERISMQATRNNSIQTFFNEEINGNPQDNKTINAAINALDSFMEGMLYVEEISVYSFTNNMLITSGKNTIRQMDRYFLQSYDSMSQEKGFIVWTEPGDTDIFGEKSSSIQLVSFFFETFNQPKGIVVVKLRDNALSGFIDTTHIRNYGFINIVNDSGKVITHNSFHDLNIDLSGYWEALRAYEGSEVITLDGEEYLFTFSSSLYNNWKYVCMLPTSEINYNANETLTILFLVSFLTISILFVLSFRLTKGLYNPIDVLSRMLKNEVVDQEAMARVSERNDEFATINKQMLLIKSQLGLERASKDILWQENKALKEKLITTSKHDQDYFYYKLLRGDVSNVTELKKLAGQFGLKFDQTYLVAVVEFGKVFETMTMNMDVSQQETLKSNIVDIYIKSMPQDCKVLNHIFESSNGCEHIVFIIEVLNGQLIMQSLKLMFNFVKNIIKNSFDMDVTVSIGKVYEGIENISRSYEDATIALKYKFVMGTGITILKSEIEGNATNLDQENYYRAHIANCLKAGNLKQIENIFSEFKENIKKSPVSTMISSYYCKEMISEIIDYLNEISYADIEDKRLINQALIHFEQKFESIFDAIDWLNDFIRTCFEKTASTETSFNRLIKQAVDIVENEYNSDISLSYISGKLSITEPYLSKLFKEETGKNYKDYLSAFRIKKAKELMRSTSLPLYEISSLVGYNYYNQFKKVFTKHERVSPVEYRETINPDLKGDL